MSDLDPSDTAAINATPDGRDLLDDVLPPLAFPRGLNERGDRLLGVIARELGPEAGERLAALSSRSALDPFVILAAGAAYALSVFCRQDRFGMGVPTRLSSAGRTASSRTTAVVFDANASGTLEGLALDFAARCRAASPCGEALPHVVFVDDPEARSESNGSTGDASALGAGGPVPNLRIGLSPGVISLNSDTGAVEAVIASSLSRSIVSFLESALGEPGRELRSLPLLGEEDRKALVVDLNRTERREFLAHDLYELVSTHFGPSSAKPALYCEGRVLNYAGLERAVEEAAAELAASGLREGLLAGICLPRSIEMVVALLAVLRSGCAYVPLDPSFPKERLEYMVEHSRLSVIICSASTRALFERPTLSFVELGSTSAKGLPAPPLAQVPPSHPAYVIYTSGSTGRPKGVAVPRSAVANMLSSVVERPGISECDSVCAITTLSFDISVLELLAPLCVGATLTIATEADARDPRRLASLLRDRRITVMQATPITWRLLCDCDWRGDLSLVALCGGEALPASLARALVPRVKQLWNMYGPTETTVWSTCCRIEDPDGAITVGSPIANTSVYVLDDSGRPLPAGAEGRLFIGGAGVAIGYLHDPELSSRRFIADPFTGRGRMYDTGDLARFDPEGLLHICGRNDSQVKLNGFRIELEEIEARLSELEAIGQAAATLRGRDRGNPGIVAFYTVVPGTAEPSFEEFRRHCASALPHYMIPSRFVRLDVMPRTPNGKLDRAGLPEPEVMAASSSTSADRCSAGNEDASDDAPRTETAGLSRIQEQFFVNSSIFEDSPAYTITSMIEARGGIDEPRLRDAWRRVLDGVPILRSAIVERGRGYAFSECGASPAAFETFECAESDLQTRAEEIACCPVSPRKPPLARLYLLRAESGCERVLLVQHHMVTDLFSTRLLARLLSRAYDNPDFVPEATPYSRFLDAEAAFITSEAGRSAERYWSAKVQGITELLRLPHASCRPESFKAEGRSIPWILPEALSRRLEASGKVPFIALLAAYAALLYRISGQERFLIGVPLTNRLLVGDCPLIGPCVNILPVLVSIDGSTRLEELYAQMRRELLLNNRHQGWPFIKIAAAFDADRDPLRPHLLQAGFTNEPLFELKLEGVDCVPVHARRNGAQMDLFFSWWRRGEAWEGNWEFNVGSFGEDEVGSWQVHFLRLLAATLDCPDELACRVPLIDEATAAALAGRGRDADYPLGKDLAHHLRDSFTRHASSTALVFEGRGVSYSEMGTRVAAVASFIFGGAGRGERIAVVLPRSPEMLYAVHGIVQSGNAYVPIGIDWPVERTLDVITDIRPAMIIGSEEFREKLAPSAITFATLGDIWAAFPEGAAIPEVEIDGSDPVYILYTSGTTGGPKGAVLPHRGIVNRLLWMQDEYRLSPGEGVMQKTPYTFDVSAWELFWPFLAGARLVIASESVHKDPREILALIERESVKVLHFVPSMLAHFLSQPNLERARSLRDVICSGESLPPALVGRFLDAFPDVGLHNLYGPTEASIDVTHWKCSRRDCELSVVPIGYPIANSRIYVLDREGLPCPPFVKGEIHIGGVGLANGYWKRDELTAEKFVPNPFGEGRLYRTGDRGRYRPDGAIEYLDRMDNVVKMRGMRVELDEIESRLRMCAGVRDAFVQKGVENGVECLIAYYVSADGGDLDTESLKRELRSYLPESMVPGFYIRMASFPLNQNGKLDRKAFPGIVARDRGPQPARGAGDDVERGVGRAWSAILGVDSGVSDRNFFDAGGNSLTLLSLREALEGEFGVELKVVDLFRNPTIERMASLIRGLRAGDAATKHAALDSAAERAQLRRASLRRPRRGADGR